MASERPGGGELTLRLPGWLRRWVDEQAREQGVSDEALLLRLLAAHSRVDGPEAASEWPYPVGNATTARATTSDGTNERATTGDEEVAVRRTDGGNVGEGEGVAGEDEPQASGDEAGAAERTGAGADEGENHEGDDPTTAPEEFPVDDLVAALREDVEAVIDARIAAADGAVDESAVAELVEAHLDGAAVGADELDERLADLEAGFLDLLEDVRERVVQVKREADAKATADHDHPELSAAAERVETIESELSALGSTLSAHEERTNEGFENFEDVLGYVTDSNEELSARQTTLARAVVETRDELRKLAARDAGRSAAEDLVRRAAQDGVTKAACGACETTVRVGLLTRAECPHCATALVGVEPASGFFGTDRLVAGDRPALEAGPSTDDGFEAGVEAIVEDESPAIDGEGMAEVRSADAGASTSAGDTESGTRPAADGAGDGGDP